MKGITIGDISIDCANPQRTRDFYAALTGWEKRQVYGCPAVVSDAGLLILFMGCDYEYVSPVWPEEPGKQQKQMHFNFQVDDVLSAEEEAIKLGATKAATQYGVEHYVTMVDPEGHPFCLCAKGGVTINENRRYFGHPNHIICSRICKSKLRVVKERVLLQRLHLSLW